MRRSALIGLGSVLLIAAFVTAAAPPRTSPPRRSAMARLFDVPVSAVDDFRDEGGGERVCIKSFPWPWGGFDQKKYMGFKARQMKELRDHLDSITARYQAGDPSLEKDLLDRPAHEREHYRNLKTGHDIEQIRLFCDLLHVRFLRREFRNDEVVRYLARQRIKYDVTARFVRIDDLDKSTYFSRQTLRNMIVAEELAARASSARRNLASTVALLADCLNTKDALRSVVGPELRLATDPTAGALSQLFAAQAQLRLDRPRWERPTVAGAWRSGSRITVYFHGKRLHTVVIDNDEFEARPVDPARAAVEFEKHVRDSLRAGSRDGIRLFHVLKVAQEYEIDFGEGKPIFLTESDAQQLARGEKLDTAHPLTLRLAAHPDACWVRWLDPLQQMGGPLEADAEAFTLALSRGYPEALICQGEQAARARRLLTDTVSAGEVAVLVAGESLPIESGKKLEASLPGARSFFCAKKDPIHEPDKRTKAVVIVAAGSAKEQVDFVQRLLAAGWLTGRVVLFAGKDGSLPPALRTELAGRCAPLALFTFAGPVDPAALPALLRQLGKGFQEEPERTMEQHWREVLRAEKHHGLWTLGG
jgi:hypothetical protein